jgi:hypothetical protein
MGNAPGAVGGEDGRRLKIGTRADEILPRVCALDVEGIARGPRIERHGGWLTRVRQGLGQRMWERIAVAASAP